MIFLPIPPRRAWLRSFWLVLSLGSGLLCSLLLALLYDTTAWAAGGLLLGAVMALPGMLWPQLAILPYRLWNSIVSCAASVMRKLLLGICYYSIFVAVGRPGARLRLARPASTESLWVPRGTLAPLAYAHQHDMPVTTSGQMGWKRTYIDWARRSGNLWAVCLLPFLILLAIVDPESPGEHPPANIYTLF